MDENIEDIIYLLGVGFTLMSVGFGTLILLLSK